MTPQHDVIVLINMWKCGGARQATCVDVAAASGTFFFFFALIFSSSLYAGYNYLV